MTDNQSAQPNDESEIERKTNLSHQYLLQEHKKKNNVEKGLREEQERKKKEEEAKRRIEYKEFMNGPWQSTKSPDFTSDFFEAAKDGKLTSIIYLLANGTNVNLKDQSSNEYHNTNRTALHYAAWKGHLSVVEYLVSQKADINAKDNSMMFQYLIILLSIMLFNMVILVLLIFW